MAGALQLEPRCNIENTRYDNASHNMYHRWLLNVLGFEMLN